MTPVRLRIWKERRSAAHRRSTCAISPSRVPRRRRRDDNREDQNSMPAFRKWDSSIEELIACAWENHRADILEQFGIYVSFGL